MPRKAQLIKDALELSGVPHRFVNGWETRGSTEFNPVGMTWHATAGSANSSAEAEVNVLLNGSATAPPPIAQFMAARDGVLWVVAAGRCNHNKVGWDGPNEGLGNSSLWGIEIQNDNRGQAYPAAQMNTVRRFTATMFRLMKADPRRRLAAHYEHQPYATRPSGETSTKSDPFGVNMADERPRVYEIMMEELDMPSPEEIAKAVWGARYSPDDPTYGVQITNLKRQFSGQEGGKSGLGPFSDWDATKKHEAIMTRFREVVEDADKTQGAVTALAGRVAAVESKLDEALALLRQAQGA